LHIHDDVQFGRAVAAHHLIADAFREARLQMDKRLRRRQRSPRAMVVSLSAATPELATLGRHAFLLVEVPTFTMICYGAIHRRFDREGSTG